MDSKMSRRTFHKLGLGTTVLGVAGTACPPLPPGAKVIGANDTIRVAFIGVGSRGCQLMDVFKKCKLVEIVGMSDADSAVLDKAAAKFAPKAAKEKDFRKLLERDDVDAVVIATPDHWHAIQMVEACKAGKDVYVEQPVSTTLQESYIMNEAAKKYNRIVQCGCVGRSSPFYLKMFDDRILDKISRVSVVRCGYLNNMAWGGIGRRGRIDPPATLDWDLWLGPRYQPYQDNIAPYKFRWWSDYSSQIASQGVHMFDTIRWLLRERDAQSVCAMGGRWAFGDDRTIPDTMAVCYQFNSGRLLTFDFFESSGNPIMATDEKYQSLGDIEFRGVNGTLYLQPNRYTIKSEKYGQFVGNGQPRMKEDSFEMKDVPLKELDVAQLHVQNFLDCMRSRITPNCDMEEGHLSCSFAHIANISLATGMRLEWESRRMQFVNYKPANTLLKYEYRSPWKLEL
ncbi:MAG: Gfo/Idh/MocA family oxidoreductase [Thermoguttaceae bacterium]|nr:Gfo/Idh/MocA family oxidoreductase [Thermoguttaceae bacterium]